MSLPRFLERVADAVGPLLGLNGDALLRRLDVAVGLHASDDGVAPLDGWLLSANLLARLYPRIELTGPEERVQAASRLILSINPACEIGEHKDIAARLTWGPADEASPTRIVVSVSGANVAVDAATPGTDAPEPLAALVAGATGAGEVFRAVFAAELGTKGRTAATPACFNIATLGEPMRLPAALIGIDIGCTALVGAGAIGQSAVLALAAAKATGHVTVVDPETVDLSNLQRYVLATDADENAEKAKLAARHLRKAGLTTNALPGRWGAKLVTERLDSVLVGLDSEQDRIGVAASLPPRAYNAWTQERDLGWSRHERFGDEPCLACLYWPDRPRPHQHETLADELRQHPLRVLAYLVHGYPAGMPLPAEGVPVTPALPAPPDAQEWTQRSILEDIAADWKVAPAELVSWHHRPLADFHREAVCAGALLDVKRGDHDVPALVPLAHQSALAGIMLVVQALIARSSQLRELRPAAIEARWNVLSPLPQIMPVPRQKTPSCLCSDADFLTASRERS